MIKIGIAFLVIGALFVIAGVAQRRRVRVETKADCLAWLHGETGSMDGYSEMRRNAYVPQRKLTRFCQQVASQEIEDALDRLATARRITSPYPRMDFTTVAEHRWFSTSKEVYDKTASNGSGGGGSYQMGMYVFSQPLFDIAMRSWYTNVSMEKGSDVVHAPDVTFDKSVVGFQTYIVTDQDRDGDDCKTHQAKLDAERKAREAKGITDELGAFSISGFGTITISNGDDFKMPPRPRPSVVVEFIDAHTIRLSRKAKSCVDGYSAMFVPPEWNVEMCNCTH